MIYIGSRDESELLSSINHHSCGAIVAYFGYVRDMVHEKKVTKMICKKTPNSKNIMNKIEQNIRKNFLVKDVILYHSTGELKPNDLVAAVIVSSIHRDEGFKACRFGIDEIKRLEPIERLDIFED